HFIDAVVIPLVVGRHLIDPLGHASVGVARKDGHRPFVVTRPLTGVPGRGVARAVVDEVQLRIVGDPTPGAAAGDLPMTALPRLDARVLADRLAEVGGLHGVDQDLIIRPFRIGTPRLPAGPEIVGGYVALHAELAARDADQDFVLYHHRSGPAGLPFFLVAVLPLLDHLFRP